MPYITLFQSPIHYQVSFDDLMNDTIDLKKKYYVSNETNTRTGFRKYVNSKLLEQFDIDKMISQLNLFNMHYDDLFQQDRHSLYQRFAIPKKSGGLRWINAPVGKMMEALRELKIIFEEFMPATYHTSAFAYVKGRSTLDAVRRHQNNQSKWFAKLDFHDFFGSTTQEFVLNTFSRIFPFSEIMKCREGLSALTRALSLCFLDGGLPQGTPISPLITNIMMIPIDFRIYNSLRNFVYTNQNGEEIHRTFVYTRYADDMIISSKYGFNIDEVIRYIKSVLKEFSAPFELNDKKTRYGSSAGSNWNLGLMLNKENQITIGYQRKRRFKAMLCNYVNDKLNGSAWALEDVQYLSGLISYYRMIEKNYIDYIIHHTGAKFGGDIERMIKDDLSS